MNPYGIGQVERGDFNAHRSNVVRSPRFLPPTGWRKHPGAFTLVELLIGATLSAAVMAAVLSSYLFLARSFTRLGNQQILETEARRTLATFAKDVQAASDIAGSPSVGFVTFSIPASSGSTTVSWNYSGAAATFTRSSGGTSQVMLRNIANGNFAIKYYDGAGNEYTTATLDAGSYLKGIKQVSLQFSTQTGVSASGTQTLVHQAASGRLLIHNRALLQ